MKSLLSKLKLNNKQQTILSQHAGFAHHAYNWESIVYTNNLLYKPGLCP